MSKSVFNSKSEDPTVSWVVGIEDPPCVGPAELCCKRALNKKKSIGREVQNLDGPKVSILTRKSRCEAKSSIFRTFAV